ncbi:NAD-dependent epimerase/dehydratase [Desulfatibacillum aliphaticivorans]|uniref:NAD-dependent epimerase/dehydratase n=1 Tax=Desulfatibacillum aliphaticivorans TaxID=218208 RepID=B8FEI6_DESAL|nr:SDR family oxidoreductase [Desulfatibacillum aliphaticivorans]ACL03390.1 NAD-dependent epimerase/dehydratase [Desulfatibacillum aliphaticivorans]
MQYLVTGGCGFIGSHISEVLAEKGEKVRILDDLSSGYEANIADFADKVEFIKGDIRDSEAVAKAMKGVDGVFHLAGMVSAFDSVERPLVCHDINVTGTLNILNAARDAGVKRVVFASSCAVYGNNPESPKVEAMTRAPASPYAASKAASELYMRVFAELYGVQTVCLRFFNVFGPRQDPSSQYSGVISRFVNDTAEGYACIYGDGLQTRDFIFVRDVVQANLLAMTSDKAGAGEPINVGTGVEISLLDLLDYMRELGDREFEVMFKDARAGDVRHSRANISKAQELLGFEPAYTIRNGLAELLFQH